MDAIVCWMFPSWCKRPLPIVIQGKVGFRCAMTDPWAFGWTQLLTIGGLVLTGIVSTFGLRTFGKWQRETIEERRIEVAVEALSLYVSVEVDFREH